MPVEEILAAIFARSLEAGEAGDALLLPSRRPLAAGDAGGRRGRGQALAQLAVAGPRGAHGGVLAERIAGSYKVAGGSSSGSKTVRAKPLSFAQERSGSSMSRAARQPGQHLPAPRHWKGGWSLRSGRALSRSSAVTRPRASRPTAGSRAGRRSGGRRAEPRVDLGGLPEGAGTGRGAAAGARGGAGALRPRRGPLLRASLVRLGDASAICC